MVSETVRKTCSIIRLGYAMLTSTVHRKTFWLSRPGRIPDSLSNDHSGPCQRTLSSCEQYCFPPSPRPKSLQDEQDIHNSFSNMSDMKASVSETANGFEVVGYEKIEYGFSFIDGVFDVRNADLADCYRAWGRCLAVMDLNIFNVYGAQMQTYFDHYGLDLKIHKTMIGEKAKSIDTLLSIVDSMNEFGIIRKVCGSSGTVLQEAELMCFKEPVLVVGGGLVTDVCGRVLPCVL
jgi:hypothetical protein